jgi:seryl-tRNA synthetase
MPFTVDETLTLPQIIIMLQISTIRENKEEVIRRLGIKNFNSVNLIDEVLDIDRERRSTQNMLDNLLATQNNLAKEIGELYKSGKAAEANDLKNKSSALKEETKVLSERLNSFETEMTGILVRIPNLPSDKVPPGKSATDNEVVFQSLHQLPESGIPHWELAAKYNLIDFEMGVKVTGAGFPVYRDKGARLQRGLINFFLDSAIGQGYQEVQPPILINEDSGFGTGQLPDKEGQMYHVGIDNLYLIPTAEVPLTNMLRDTILKLDELPVKLTGYTPCFRREAGSYGKDVRGLNRLHQFDKVEIVQVAEPSNSYRILEEMKDYVTGLLEQLRLPYRVLRLCGGDMSFASAMTYDMEVYSSAQKRWLEVSSVSNFETFQSNRLKLRYRDTEGRTTLAHTLNGSALALPRIVAALLENNQTPAGIQIPPALVPYTGFEIIS